MKRSFALPLLLLPLAGCGGSSSADQTPEPSVLVSLAKPARGSLPQSIEAFGSAAPGTNGAQTISVAQPGQVIRLAVTSGTAVRAGQVLGTFMVAPTARGAYLQAEEALAAAQKQRDSTAQLLTQQLATRDQLVQAEKAVSDARVALAGLRAEGADQAVQTLTAPFDGVVEPLSVAATVADNLLLLETAAPVPIGGQPGHPSLTRRVAEKLAGVKGVSFEEIAEVTSANFSRYIGAG